MSSSDYVVGVSYWVFYAIAVVAKQIYSRNELSRSPWFARRNSRACKLTP